MTVDEERVWNTTASIAGVLAAVAVRKLISAAWENVSDVDPPLNPADRRVSWSSALSWGVAAGAGAGVARVVSQRLAAGAFERAVGRPPPGVVTDRVVTD